MNNFTYYKNAILKNAQDFAVCRDNLTPGVCIKEIPCQNCLFYDTGLDCKQAILEWLYDECPRAE